jgi:hypothetical protein
MEAAEKATPWACQHNTFLIEKRRDGYQINNERQLLSYLFYGPTETEK